MLPGVCLPRAKHSEFSKAESCHMWCCPAFSTALGGILHSFLWRCWHTGSANSCEGSGWSRKGSCIHTGCCKFTLENQNLVRHCLRGTFTRHAEVKFTPPSFHQPWWKPRTNVILGVDIVSAAVRQVLRNGYVKLRAQMPGTCSRTLILNSQGQNWNR